MHAVDEGPVVQHSSVATTTVDGLAHDAHDLAHKGGDGAIAASSATFVCCGFVSQGGADAWTLTILAPAPSRRRATDLASTEVVLVAAMACGGDRHDRVIDIVNLASRFRSCISLLDGYRTNFCARSSSFPPSSTPSASATTRCSRQCFVANVLSLART